MRFRRIFILFFLVNLQIVYSQGNFLPIIAFQGVPESHNTDQDFQNLKKAGFNVNLNMYSNINAVKKALTLCQKYNIKLIFSVPDLRTNPDIIKSVKNHPALLGYYIYDEPSPSLFENLSEVVNKLNQIDSHHIKYINLHPIYAPNENLENRSYPDYVREYLNKVSVNIISFDHYSLTNNKIRPNWYNNLEIIRQTSIKFNKPFWAFACSVIHFNYLQPTVGGIKLQQFSNLLYGAKGLQYYTYWNVNDEYWKINNYSYAIADENGKPTPSYSIVKSVNEQIDRIAWLFISSKVDSVYHIGSDIPIGTKKMDFVPEKFTVFNSYAKPALVSYMSIGSKKYILVQNKDIHDSIPFNYKVTSGVNIIDRNTGKTKNISTKSQIENIPPGDILIFAYK